MEDFNGEKWIMASRRVWAAISAALAAIFGAVAFFGVELPTWLGVEVINGYVPAVLAAAAVILGLLSKLFPDNAVLRWVMKAGFNTQPIVMLVLACFIGLACASGPAYANGKGKDIDGDGVRDKHDNCIADFNPMQIDADVPPDGIGNRCDADLDQSGGVDVADFGIFVQIKNGAYDARADLIYDHAVDEVDFARFRQLFARSAPGPSAGK